VVSRDVAVPDVLLDAVDPLLEPCWSFSLFGAGAALEAEGAESDVEEDVEEALSRITVDVTVYELVVTVTYTVVVEVELIVVTDGVNVVVK
jgi:hypothetical protein